tara:strand:+ start:789 stop:1574 length:786 start_codon:yes stop_codon:yes gene_type:complete
MIKVTIEDNTYEVRNEWEDNTINDLNKPQEYIKTLPQWLESYIYTDSNSPISDSKLLDFYVDWIELFSDIPRTLLEEVVAVKDEEHSIMFLFNAVSKFLGEPTQDDIEPNDTITFRNKDYTLIESVKTAGGIDKLLGGATYKHFAEANALSHLFQNKNYRKWEYIARITAILFRPDPNEQYNEDIIDQRTKEFGKLPVSEAYKGYFFLSNSLTNLQQSTLTSFREKVVNPSTVNQKPLLKIPTIKSKLLTWLKKVSLTNKG